MKPVIRDFVTGLTAIGSLAGLIVMLMLFGELRFDKNYTFQLHVTNAGGLSGTSSVTLNGVKVGKVSATKVSDRGGADLTVEVRQTVGIPKVSEISIEKSFVGDAALEFSIPQGATAEQLRDTIPPGSVFEGGEALSTIGRLAAAIEKPLSRIEATAGNIDKLAATYTTVGERINEMLEPRTMAEVNAGKPPNLRSTIARADEALANASKLISDQELVAHAKNVLTKADTIMDQASSLATTWTKTAGTVDQQVTRIGNDLDSVANDAANTLRNTDKAAGELAVLLEGVNKGQGTVGQLMQNPDLYNSIHDAAVRLERALTAFQLLVEKYKAEGIPLHL